MTIRVEIPILPPRELSPNARVHWSKKARATANLRSTTSICAWIALQSQSGTLSRATVRVQLVIRDTRQVWDSDNLLAALKPAIDGCVDAGVIAGDDPAHLNYQMLIEWVVNRDQAPKTILEFTEVNE